jgi:type I restriction enzyme, S subunit
MNKTNWKKVKLGEICQLELGKTPPSKDQSFWSNDDTGYQWFSISDFGNQHNTNRKVTQKAYHNVFRGQLRPAGTLIMSFKLTIGKVAILPFDSFHNEAIVSIFPNESQVIKEYLFIILPISVKSGKSNKAVKGETLNKKSLSDLEIPLPPLDEQEEIVRRCQEVEAKQKKLLSQNLAQKEHLKKLQEKVLDMAIRGELTKDFETSETAEDLYQQIQQEREALITAGKMKKPKPLPPIDPAEIPFKIPHNWKWVRLGEIFQC